jgi:hypothetical protein
MLRIWSEVDWYKSLVTRNTSPFSYLSPMTEMYHLIHTDMKAEYVSSGANKCDVLSTCPVITSAVPLAILTDIFYPPPPPQFAPWNKIWLPTIPPKLMFIIFLYHSTFKLLDIAVTWVPLPLHIQRSKVRISTWSAHLLFIYELFNITLKGFESNQY